MRLTRSSRTWTLGLMALLAPTLAGAGPHGLGHATNESFINPGLLLGAAWREGHVVGAPGVELSFHHFDDSGLGAGFFAQWQWMALTSHRFSGGLQLTAPDVQVLGVELGMAYETRDEQRAATASIHVAPFVTAGVATLSLRFGMPVYAFDGEPGSTPLPRRTFEFGLNLAIKYPLPADS